jgi:predicted protein tyrosine phosphatase
VPGVDLMGSTSYVAAVKKVLFICSRNELRSPTAEQVFSSWPGLEVSSAGLDPGCANPVSPEDLRRADLIFVMEPVHRAKLSRQFKPHLKNARVICLGVPDNYAYMAPDLVALLEAKVAPHLR